MVNQCSFCRMQYTPAHALYPDRWLALLGTVALSWQTVMIAVILLLL